MTVEVALQQSERPPTPPHRRRDRIATVAVSAVLLCGAVVAWNLGRGRHSVDPQPDRGPCASILDIADFPFPAVAPVYAAHPSSATCAWETRDGEQGVRLSVLRFASVQEAREFFETDAARYADRVSTADTYSATMHGGWGTGGLIRGDTVLFLDGRTEVITPADDLRLALEAAPNAAAMLP
jgi:hypothetical protein